MASAQNFFNSTPAPDPRQNTALAGLAGGLQGMADQGTYQKQMQLMQMQNNQKQMADMINAGAQNRQAGFGPGPEGSTPMQIGGQQGYWDPNGMSPAGQMDLSKSQLYQTMNANKANAPQNLEAHTLATTLLKGIADRYSNGVDKKYTLDKYQSDAAGAMDFVKKRYGMDQQDDNSDSSDQSQQSAAQMFAGKPGYRDAQGNLLMAKSPAQQMFSSATGQSNATPRSQRMQDAVQGLIDAQKKKGVPAARIKTMMQQAGHDPSKYDI